MRTSGVLLPIFSLAGKYGIGCFSREAYEFVDFLKDAGQTYWQILPLGPTSYGDSPYQSFSTFAGNPYFIDPVRLMEEGLLTEEELKEEEVPQGRNIDYSRLFDRRFLLLKKAFNRANLTDDAGYRAFCDKNADWLTDYAMYMAIKVSFHNAGLDSWDDDIRLRKQDAMERYEEDLRSEIAFYQFLQYKFDEQWSLLKTYANDKGIKIIGDMPIYVSGDSSDVWANPELFQLDEEMRPTRVAGCPPDAFSETGQLWGNPLYTWDYHKKTCYEWWKKRVGKAVEWYDVVRIDHFRGFDEYYSIPGDADTAVNGKWMPGPGYDLFKALDPILKSRNAGIIAEDLGFITDTVRQLVTDTGFPNMKVIQFAWGEPDADLPNEYLPMSYKSNCIAYTGTHDNETMYGWLKNQDKTTIEFIRDYTDCHSLSLKKLVRALIRQVMASPADYCVVPLQDWLGLDNSARINTPSTLGNNWAWRMRPEMLTEELAGEMKKMTALYARKNILDYKHKAEDKEEELTKKAEY